MLATFNHLSWPNRPIRSRRGLSLLEVLISMFILLFGLVGVASLFPIGKFHTQEALRYDQAAAVGQRAFEEIRVRGLLRPDRWNLQNGTRFTDQPNWQSKAVFFDPLAVAPPVNSSAVLVGNTSPLQRVTWRTSAGTNMTLPNADCIFKSHEDLAFELPAQRTIPPIQRITTVEREYKGSYSWAFMAIPAPKMGEGCYNVTVVVFRNRAPGKEWGSLNSDEAIGNSVGQTKLKLKGTVEQCRNIKIGEWVLISLQGQSQQNYFYWYKLVAIGYGGPGFAQLQAEGITRPPAFNNSIFTTVFGNAVAAYEKTMMVEVGTDWSID